MVNDISIISGIVIIFIALGSLLPFINSAFSNQVTITDTSGFQQNLANNVENSGNPTSAFSIIKSVFLMFFFTFGALPFWIDAFLFIPMRIALVLIIARNIWIGGGG